MARKAPKGECERGSVKKPGYLAPGFPSVPGLGLAAVRVQGEGVGLGSVLNRAGGT